MLLYYVVGGSKILLGMFPVVEGILIKFFSEQLYATFFVCTQRYRLQRRL